MKKEIVIETQRLYLRELVDDDFSDWFEILSDEETMKYYPEAFTEEKVRRWINWNKKNYNDYGFGLWAVILKENDKFIGDCGITMQNINGKLVPEIGYHIHKNYQKKGYATEASKKCQEFIFTKTDNKEVYSYMKYTNVPSYTVAMKCGMKFLEEYPDEVNTYTKVFSITKEEWEKKNNETDRFKDIKNRILKFVNDRDWNQFHTPCNLAKSISIEANELLECFQWDDNKYNKEDVYDELADVMNYCIQMSQVLNVDIVDILNRKLDKTEKKYPIEKAKGVSTKYNKL